MKKRFLAMLLALVMCVSCLAGFEVLAADGKEYTVIENGSVKLIGTKGYSTNSSYHTWTSSDESVAKVTPYATDYSTAKVAGQDKEANVTIKHQYKLTKNGSWQTETFSVHIVPPVTKTVHWTEEGKTAQIVIQSLQTKEALGVIPKVLFMGSVCNQHGLSDTSYITNAINTLAGVADVDYRISGLSYKTLKTNDTNGTNGTKEGTVLKEETFSDTLSAGSGYHVSQYYFADKINELKASGKLDEYDLIVLEFDGVRMGWIGSDYSFSSTGFNQTEVASKLSDNYYGTTLTYAQIEDRLAKAAFELVDLYADNKVAWLVPPMKDYNGSSSNGGQYFFDDNDFGGNASRQPEINHTTIAWDVLAIMAPEIWLDKTVNPTTGEVTYLAKKGTQPTTQTAIASAIFGEGSTYVKRGNSKYDSTKPSTSEANLKAMWTTYGKAEDITALINAKAEDIIRFEQIDIQDIIADGFEIVSVEGQYLDESKDPAEWTYITNPDYFNYTIDDREISAQFNLSEIRSDKTRLLINILATERVYYDPENDNMAVTNEGSVVVTYDGDKNNTIEVDPPALKHPGIDLEKTASIPDGQPVYVGKTITYTFKITNVGDSKMTKVLLQDDLLGYTLSETEDKRKDLTPEGGLDVGESVTYSEDYVVTEADLEKEGSILKNFAEASGITPDGTCYNQDAVSNPVAAPALEVTKTSSYTGKTSGTALKSGDTVTYTVSVKNIGTTELTDIVITDKKDGVSAVASATGAYTIDEEDDQVVKVARLAAGSSIDVTFEYTVTEDDMIAKAKDSSYGIVNSVEVTAKDPEDEDIEPIDATSGKDPVEAAKPGLSVRKSSDKTGETVKAGEEITYLVYIKNTGNITLENIEVVDAFSGAEALVSSHYNIDSSNKNKVTIPSLEPNEHVNILYSYIVTEDDAASNAALENTAAASCEDPTDPTKKVTTESDKASNDVASFTATKTSSYDGKAAGKAPSVGTKITYTVNVKNTGSAALQNIEVVDQKDGVSAVSGNGYTVDSSNKKKVTVTSLAKGADIDITYEYTVTEEDMIAVAAAEDPDDAAIVNTVKVTAEDPDGDKLDEKTATSEGDVPEEAAPALEITKVSNKAGKTLKADEQITYTVSVKNTGNVTLKDVVVTDALSGAEAVTSSAYTIDSSDKNKVTIGQIAPNGTVDVKYTYTVTEDDAASNAGLENTATATCDDPTDPTKTVEPEEPGKTSNDVASFTVTKTSSYDGKASGEAPAAGDTITYTVTVTNTGSAALSNIVVIDQMEDAVAVSGNGYSIDSSNNKKVTVTSLAKGASIDITYEYTVTEEDMIAVAEADDPEDAAIVNSVKVTAEDPDGDKLDEETATSEGDVPEEADPALEVTKTSDKVDETLREGEEITYTVTVENTGNVTLEDVVVADGLSGTEAVASSDYTIDSSDKKKVTIDSLKPGDTVEVKYTYTVTEDDATSGEDLENTATASCEDPTDPTKTVTPEEPGETSNKTASYSVTKVSDQKDNTLALGDVITYTVTVTNTGSAAISGVTIEESMEDAVPDDTKGAAFTVSNGKVLLTDPIAVGASAVVYYTYTVTEDDLIAARDNDATIVNTVNVKANDPDGDPISEDGVEASSDPDTAEDADVEITVDKTSDKVDPASGEALAVSVGDDITYTVIVTNVGNVTVENILVEDAMEGAVAVESTDGSYVINDDGSVTITSIAPAKEGDTPNSVSVKFTYTVTDDDLNGEDLKNTASAQGEDKTDEPSNEDDGTASNPTAGYTVSKVSSYEGKEDGKAAALGQEITYTVTVTNIGSSKLTGFEIEDILKGAVPQLEGTEYTLTQAGAVAIGDLAVGASKSVIYKYTVTEQDILAAVQEENPRNIVNKVNVTAKNKDDKTITGDASCEDTPEDPKPAITVEKTSSVAEGTKVNVGDTIYFYVTVTNTGNLTVTGIEVSDALEGIKLAEGETGVIEKLAPGESETVTFEYMVTKEDAELGSIKNTADAEGNASNGGNPEGSGNTSVDVRTFLETDDPEDHIYDGEDHKWIPEVNDKDGNPLTEGEDYTVTYYDEEGNELKDPGDFTDVKEITVVIEGIGDYTGETTKTYEIIPQSINPERDVDPEDPEKGKEEDPTYKGVQSDDPEDVKYDGKDHKWVPTVTDDKGNPLEEGKDYTVTYLDEDGNEVTDFTKPQTITVVIQGEGNYDNTLVKEYTITPPDVPQTGDNSNVLFWSILMLICLAGASLGIVSRRRKCDR